MDANRRERLRRWALSARNDVQAADVLTLLAYVDELEAKAACGHCGGRGVIDWIDTCLACGGTGNLADAVARKVKR